MAECQMCRKYSALSQMCKKHRRILETFRHFGKCVGNIPALWQDKFKCVGNIPALWPDKVKCVGNFRHFGQIRSNV